MFERALAKDPKCMEAASALCTLLCACKRHQEAIVVYVLVRMARLSFTHLHRIKSSLSISLCLSPHVGTTFSMEKYVSYHHTEWMHVRVADLYFLTKDWQKALNHYNIALR